MTSSEQKLAQSSKTMGTGVKRSLWTGNGNGTKRDFDFVICKAVDFSHEYVVVAISHNRLKKISTKQSFCIKKHTIHDIQQCIISIHKKSQQI